MAKYFTLTELARSETAARHGIDNTPPPEAAARLEALAENLLDHVRELRGAPLTVNSGYRCPELNRVLGGAARSQHMCGEAADITTGSREGNRRLFDMVLAAADAGKLEFDRLIDEHDYSWLHISYRVDNNRRKTLHL